MRLSLDSFAFQRAKTDDSPAMGYPAHPLQKFRLVLGSKGAGSSTTGGDSSRGPHGGQRADGVCWQTIVQFLKNRFFPAPGSGENAASNMLNLLGPLLGVDKICQQHFCPILWCHGLSGTYGVKPGHPIAQDWTTWRRCSPQGGEFQFFDLTT